MIAAFLIGTKSEKKQANQEIRSLKSFQFLKKIYLFNTGCFRLKFWHVTCSCEK